MLPLEYILALTLLTSPTFKEELVIEEAKYYLTLQPLLKDYCLAHEYMDEREKNYIFVSSKSVGSNNYYENEAEVVPTFISDLKLMRSRYRDLKDAPLVCDHIRFPSREIVMNMLKFNLQYREHLEAKISLYGESSYRSEEYNQALQETIRLYQIWSNVQDSKTEYYYVTVRRMALQEVRNAVGFPAYYNGTMPPHVPVWRFKKID